MNIKRILLFTVVLMIVVASLSMVSAGWFDFLGGNDNDSSDDIYNGSFILRASNISVVSSSIDITRQEIASDEYAYFDKETGEYAGAAYTKHNSDDIYIQLDMKNINLSDNSILESSDSSGEKIVYNETNLEDDLSKLINSDNVSIELKCCGKTGGRLHSYDDLDVSLDNGILTLKYSNSTISEYYYSNSPAKKYDPISDIDHAYLEINGEINDTNSSKEIVFKLSSENMPVTLNISE